MNVLIVDDQTVHRYTLAHVLRRIPGMSIVEANGGIIALTLLRSSQFDLVICDFHMPDLDGYYVFKATEKLEHPPKFYLWTDEDSDKLPPFTGPNFAGIIRKAYMQQVSDLFVHSC